jgi:hypothetical protein
VRTGRQAKRRWFRADHFRLAHLRFLRREADFGCRLVLAQTLIDDLAQQVVVGPGKKLRQKESAKWGPWPARGDRPGAVGYRASQP